MIVVRCCIAKGVRKAFDMRDLAASFRPQRSGERQKGRRKKEEPGFWFGPPPNTDVLQVSALSTEVLSPVVEV